MRSTAVHREFTVKRSFLEGPEVVNKSRPCVPGSRCLASACASRRLAGCRAPSAPRARGWRTARPLSSPSPESPRHSTSRHSARHSTSGLNCTCLWLRTSVQSHTSDGPILGRRSFWRDRTVALREVTRRLVSL